MKINISLHIGHCTPTRKNAIRPHTSGVDFPQIVFPQISNYTGLQINHTQFTFAPSFDQQLPTNLHTFSIFFFAASHFLRLATACETFGHAVHTESMKKSEIFDVHTNRRRSNSVASVGVGGVAAPHALPLADEAFLKLFYIKFNTGFFMRSASRRDTYIYKCNYRAYTILGPCHVLETAFRFVSVFLRANSDLGLSLALSLSSAITPRFCIFWKLDGFSLFFNWNETNQSFRMQYFGTFGSHYRFFWPKSKPWPQCLGRMICYFLGFDDFSFVLVIHIWCSELCQIFCFVILIVRSLIMIVYRKTQGRFISIIALTLHWH